MYIENPDNYIGEVFESKQGVIAAVLFPGRRKPVKIGDFIYVKGREEAISIIKSIESRPKLIGDFKFAYPGVSGTDVYLKIMSHDSMRKENVYLKPIYVVDGGRLVPSTYVEVYPHTPLFKMGYEEVRGLVLVDGELNLSFLKRIELGDREVVTGLVYNLLNILGLEYYRGIFKEFLRYGRRYGGDVEMILDVFSEVLRVVGG